MTFPRRIDQILAGFAGGDAISHEARAIQAMIRGWGVESEIYADRRHVAPDSADLCRGIEEYRGDSRDAVIHHYSIASPAVDVFMKTSAKRIVLYHNITPAQYYEPFDERIAAQLRDARSALKDVLPRVDAVWAVSRYNAGELESMGAAKVGVFPLLFDRDRLDIPADRGVVRRYSGPMKNILFVGRVAPNKKIEDLILAFTWYHCLINRQSRLLIVGSERSAPRYSLMLGMLCRELCLPNANFIKFASPEGLSAFYEIADLFMTTSEHEGYCLPLVEAMYKKVPVIARNLGGMPEALGGAGVMYDNADPRELALLMDRVISDECIRREILDSQERRIEELLLRRPDDELKALVASL